MAKEALELLMTLLRKTSFKMELIVSLLLLMETLTLEFLTALNSLS